MVAHAGQLTTPEHDFALIVGGVAELNEQVEEALFNAGCDDATLSMRYGLLYIEFSRSVPTLKEAILSAIHDIAKSGLPIFVLRVDDCNLVTPADIARRIRRSRQLVHQYMTSKRGPGGFPAPVCHLSDQSPLWDWRDVSDWLAQHSLLSTEESRNARLLEAINAVLQQQHRSPDDAALMDEIGRALRPVGGRR